LDEAAKMLQKPSSWLDDPTGDGRKRVDEARRKLQAEEAWVEQQLEQMRRRAAERARKQLEQGGDEEDQLAERARELAEKSEAKGTLPQQVTESIDDAQRAAREAARALKQGDAERGLGRQREAQRHLETARQRLEQGEPDEGQGGSTGDSDGNQLDPEANIKIPGKGEHKGPEEFRRRVMRGLSQPGNGALRDAVRRYAEGLLR
jgi:hypothetical protein